MCEHHHNHQEKHNYDKINIIQIALSAVFLVLCLVFKLHPLFFIIAYLISGYSVIIDAIKNIFQKNFLDENFLMTIATLGALLIKEYPEAVMVMILFKIGEYLEHKAVEKSKKSISDLIDLRPKYANIEDNGVLVKKSPETIKINDIIVVKTGEKVPLDGLIVEGSANVDTSALTGEFLPKNLQINDKILSGFIVKDGFLKIKVLKEYKNSTVAKIIELIKQTSSKKTKTENFITKFAKYYTPLVVLAAILLGVVVPITIGKDFSLWFQKALIFLVISCPCALVISVPLSFFSGIGKASKKGVLIKGSNFIEALANVETMAFDKTGTLTKGVFEVIEINSNIEQDEFFKYIINIENYSNHPVANSIKNYYQKPIEKLNVSSFLELPSKGVSAFLDNDLVLIGNEKLMIENNIDYKPPKNEGAVIYCAKNGKYLGNIVISDKIKETSKETIEKLKKENIKTVLLTGDNEFFASKTAFELKIDKFYYGLLPLDKVRKIEELIQDKTKNKSVIFAGDGLNDAPVLTRADVGISMGILGTDASIEASDVIIGDDNPLKIIDAIKISKKTIKIAKENIIFALSIKILFLILGLFGLITMWFAVFCDVGVTLIAILNSLRILKN